MNRKANLLTGKWLVSYQPDDFSLPRVLEILMNLHLWRESNARNCTMVRVDLSRIYNVNSIHMGLNELDARLRDHKLDQIKTGALKFPEPNYVQFSPFSIKRIMLLYPAMISDKRWKSIDIPTTWLFLGSSLQNANFSVDTRILPLPAEPSNIHCKRADVLGFTLYEDNLPELSDFLKLIRVNYSRIIAAGGPLITHNPLQSAYHLPEINLLVRGEADIVFSDLLQAINTGNLDLMFRHSGFLFHWNGLMIISDFDRINRPADFTAFHFNLDFLRDDQLSNGLELNTSRGCRGSCLFCSHLQGKPLRKIPLDMLDLLMGQFSHKLKSLTIDSPGARTVNINDDDILQDPEHTRGVFKLLKKHRFKLWGIQTSINSFFSPNHTIDTEIINLLTDKNIFVNQTPLLWIGTDTFLVNRGKRLGKQVPEPALIETLIGIFDKYGIGNYHYWISSDSHTAWSEFIDELLVIFDLKNRFDSFHILAHSPFLIPYSATPIYKIIMNDPNQRHLIKARTILKTGHEPFDFIQVDRVETSYPYLNRLLCNEAVVDRSGFFDYLQSDDSFNALNTALTYLRQERLALEAYGNPGQIAVLKKVEQHIDFKIGELMS
jgi:hypothetical protein